MKAYTIKKIGNKSIRSETALVACAVIITMLPYFLIKLSNILNGGEGLINLRNDRGQKN